MAYCVMNVDKQKRSAVYGLQIEANRQADDEREFLKSDIDWSRTKENIQLRHTDRWNIEITRQIKQADVKERKDSVVALTGVYTASPEWFDSHSKQEMMDYFRSCLEYHDRTYGYCFNAVIHLDEKTPHLQCISVPIYQDEHGKNHLSAKQIMGNREDYYRRQDDFYEQVGREYGMERGTRSNPTQTRKHLEKIEWLTREADQKLADRQNELERVQFELTQERAKLRSTIKKIDKLTEQVEKKIIAKPPILNRKTIEIHASMYDSVKESLAQVRKLANEVAKASDTLDYDNMRLKEEYAKVSNAQAQLERLETQQCDIILHQAKKIAHDAICQERTEVTERMIDYMQSIHDRTGQSAYSHFLDQELELRQRIDDRVDEIATRILDNDIERER